MCGSFSRFVCSSSSSVCVCVFITSSFSTSGRSSSSIKKHPRVSPHRRTHIHIFTLIICIYTAIWQGHDEDGCVCLCVCVCELVEEGEDGEGGFFFIDGVEEEEAKEGEG